MRKVRFYFKKIGKNESNLSYKNLIGRNSTQKVTTSFPGLQLNYVEIQSLKITIRFTILINFILNI